MSNNKIYIIGRNPPPIGGVTTFNQRLVNILRLNYFKVDLLDNAWKILVSIFTKQRNLYLLSFSNRYLLISLSLIFRVFNHRIASVVHGDIERGSKFHAKLLLFLRILNHNIIVLNDSSFNFFNNKDKIVKLGTNLISCDAMINERIIDKNFSFVTYASRHIVNAKHQDLYGIDFLYEFFERTKRRLIILDPNNSYRHLLSTKNIELLREPVSINKFLGKPWVYVRNTLTDGDSLLIHEAMEMGSPVIASDIVNRPEGILLFRYSDENGLEKCISKLISYELPKPKNHTKEWIQFLKILCSE